MKVQIKSTLYKKRAHKRVRPETKDKKKHQRYKILYGVQCHNFKGKVLDRKKCPKKSALKRWFCKNVGDQKAEILQFKDSKV